MSFNATVAVTGINAADNVAPGVGVIRGLRSDRDFLGRVVGLAYDAMESGLFIDGLLDAAYLIPYPSAGAAPLRERLTYIQSGPFKIDVLIPCLDAEILPFIRMAGDLEQLGIRTFLPTEAQFKARAKTELVELAESCNLDTPRMMTAVETPFFFREAHEVGYPLHVKGLFYESYAARSPEEAVVHFERIKARWGLPVIVQEHVPGEEYDIVGLGDGEGGLVGAVAMRKMTRTETGKAWAGVAIRNPELSDMAGRFVASTRWRGPFELEVMHTRDGRDLLLEVNPRFPAWVYLSVAAGQNLPAAAARLALGESVAPMKDLRPGTLFVRYALDAVAEISRFEQIAALGEMHRTEESAP